MGSESLDLWKTDRSKRLDNLFDIHRATTNGTKGRKWATEQLNHALILRLASEYQGFCRDIHSEAIDFILANSVNTTSSIESVLRANLEFGRKLDSGNANAGNLGNDFSRLAFPIVKRIKQSAPVNEKRLQRLQELNDARNAIAHADDGKLGEVSTVQPLTLGSARRWRSALNGLAVAMDVHLGAYLKELTGIKPW